MDTRELLLQAAAPIFAERGLEGSTVKDIAASAGVNVALISYHFGGKEGLYKALLHSIGTERLAAAERILQPVKSHDEFRLRLKLFFDEFMLFHVRNPHCMRIVHRDFDVQQPIVGEVFKEILLKIYFRLQEFFEDAKRAGVIRDDVEADPSAAMFFGGILHCVQWDGLRRETLGFGLADDGYAGKVVDQFVRNFCDGALTRGEK